MLIKGSLLSPPHNNAGQRTLCLLFAKDASHLKQKGTYSLKGSKHAFS